MDSSVNYAETLPLLFSNYLKNKRLRNTAERSAICLTVCQTNKPFTPEIIRQQMENSKFPVSRASVYNTIELLLDSKIIVRHQFSSSNVQYELKDIAEQHMHAICTQCGTVRKIKNERLNSLFTDYKIPKFTLEHYSLHFYGICSKCKYRLKQKKNTNQ